MFPAVNTLYNALLHQSRLRQDRLEHAQIRDRRRHGGAEIGCRRLGKSHRQADHRRLRTFGNFAGTHRAIAATSPNGPAPSACRCPRPTFRSATTTATKWRTANTAKSARAGPQVMLGYWRRPEETAQGDDGGRLLPHRRHRRDGQSGPCAHRRPQEGHDLVSGFKVFPNEVEDVAMSQGGLLECAAGRRAGRTFRRGGQAVRGQEERPTSRADDSARVSAPRSSPSYKVPKQIEFRDELPKTNVGKILRRALRDEPSTPAN